MPFHRSDSFMSTSWGFPFGGVHFLEVVTVGEVDEVISFLIPLPTPC